MLLFACAYWPEVKAQCPPGASALEVPYPSCTSGCAVLLKGWPDSVVVNIFGGNPLEVITSATTSSSGSAFICVPCNISLTFASAVPDSSNGCVITIGSIVPITISSFSVSLSNGADILNWVVAFEQGQVNYTVQRSNNGNSFNDISSIQGNNNGSTDIKYSYSDITSGQGTLYYRLKITQQNGSISYTPIISINNLAFSGIKIYPNPVTGNNFTMNIPDEMLPANFSIVDAAGRVVYQSRILEATSTINAEIASGIYALKIIGKNNSSLIQKIIKK